jgi:hypothetical protein
MAPAHRQGLLEYVIVFALLALAAAGAAVQFREPIRALFGAPRAASAPAPSPPR